MQTITPKKLDIKIIKTHSPLQRSRAWQIESFCLKIFGYIDYSLSKALAGSLDSRLRCEFFLAETGDDILAAAGCLYCPANPAVAILVPVCTDPQYRNKGLAFELCCMLLEHLKAQKVQAVYLGVKNNVPAVNLYKKLGFAAYSGIVMRKLFVSEDDLNKRYSQDQETIVRKISWRDFAQVSSLFCEPAKIVSFDFGRQIFSSRYTEIQRFLPVFPVLINDIENKGTFGLVLETTETKSIVGSAFIKSSPSEPQNHIAVLEFFVLDGFIDKARYLVSRTVTQPALGNDRMILCYCPQCDIYKKQILLSLGAEPYAVLPESVRLQNKLHNTIIYKLARKL